MLFDDTYKEITKESIGIYKERNSKFIAYAFYIEDEVDIKIKLEHVKKNNDGGNHYCYAYMLYKDRSYWRVHDDGEPKSTAGKPILSQIEKHRLTNIIIITIRYFGGTKLGIPGLIRSYKNAALDAINNNTIITKSIQDQYEVLFRYKYINKIMTLTKKYNLNIIDTNFNNNNCILLFTVNRTRSDLIFHTIKKENELTIKYIKTV
jgi:uncharacterized YigZ family protein